MMKKYTIKDGSYYIINDVVLSTEEINKLATGTKKEKEAIKQKISDLSTPVLANEEDSAIIDALYNEYKPKLKEDDNYELLSFDVAVGNGVRMGSYNYKLNKSIFNIIIK